MPSFSFKLSFKDLTQLYFTYFTDSPNNSLGRNSGLSWTWMLIEMPSTIQQLLESSFTAEMVQVAPAIIDGWMELWVTELMY